MIRPGPDLGEESTFEVCDQSPREEQIPLPVDDVRPDRHDRDTAARRFLLNELFRGSLAAGVEVLVGERLERIVLGDSLFACLEHGGATVYGDRRDVNEARTGLARRVQREASAADVHARELVARI